jgi:hypothetical protein
VKLGELQLDIVVLACAISAGIHGALISDHFHEAVGAGVGFVAATVLLAAAAVALTRRADPLTLTGTAALLVGLLLSYAFAVTTGVPVLHPAVETVDGLALFTKAVEAVGLITATSLLRPGSGPAAAPEPKGTLT